MEGDWHDTVCTLQKLGTLDKMTMRFHTETFTGPVVMHCHILPHEDLGMMGVACIYDEDIEAECRNQRNELLQQHQQPAITRLAVPGVPGPARRRSGAQVNQVGSSYMGPPRP